MSSFGIAILSLTFMLWVSSNLYNVVLPGGWSIQAEVFHYAIFPIVRRMNFQQLIQILTIINLITAIIFFLEPVISRITGSFVQTPLEAWIRLNLYSTFGWFLLGMIGYQFLSDFRVDKDIGATIVRLGLQNPKLIAFYFFTWMLVPLNFGNNLEAMGFCLIFLTIANGILGTKFPKQIMRLLGKYSYFIYFIHFQVLAIIMLAAKDAKLDLSSIPAQPLIFIALLLFTLTISVFLGKISFSIYESPMMRFSQKIK
jgi:peptidoglycan/LPS O-acetylase OafA/YrhL